jgi:twinkle protein
VKRKTPIKQFDPDFVEAAIITAKSQTEEMLETFQNGRPFGTPTYCPIIDRATTSTGHTNKAWSWKLKEITIWTGYNNEGKSQFLLWLAIMKAKNEGWKFAVFSPENYPASDFYDDLIHTLTGQSTDKTAPSFSMTDKEYLEALEWVNRHFFFVYPIDPETQLPDFRIETIETIFEYLEFTEGVKGCFVDPYIKIRHELQGGEPEHLYASRFMADRVNFTRRSNLSYHLVMHQNTPRKNSDGNYPKPNLYNIKGGGTYADSADNVMIVQRPYRGVDPMSTSVLVTSDKIKRQKLVGIPMEISFDFSRKLNQYIDPVTGENWLGGRDLSKFQPKAQAWADFKNIDIVIDPEF